jgi:hypothetical protein
MMVGKSGLRRRSYLWIDTTVHIFYDLWKREYDTMYMCQRAIRWEKGKGLWKASGKIDGMR